MQIKTQTWLKLVWICWMFRLCSMIKTDRRRLTSCLPFILQIRMSFLFDSHVLFYKWNETRINTAAYPGISLVENDIFQLQDKWRAHLKGCNCYVCLLRRCLPCCKTSHLLQWCPAPHEKGHPWRGRHREGVRQHSSSRSNSKATSAPS